MFAAKAGPSLHILPYRVVDLSLFFEAGIAVVAPTSRHSAAMPVLGTGKAERIRAAAAADALSLSREDWYGVWEAAHGHRIP